MTANTKDRLPDGTLLTWYGDDFTGATAVMEVMTFAGLPSVLFFDVPTNQQLQQFEGYRAIGIAGVARSKSPRWMDENLPRYYEALAAIGAPVSHYKFCSTLDSSPETGSIGRATELALPLLGGDWHPLVVAAPEIRRYQAFGNLFAVMDGTTYRLDRHPSMSRHPVTPMNEADIRMHLARQTDLALGLVDVVDLTTGNGADALARERSAGRKVVAFDIVDEATLAEAGRIIWSERGERIFASGSQGLEYALVAAWRRGGLLERSPDLPGLAAVERIAIVSGSCSPVTAQQIRHAEENGFASIPVDPARAVDADAWARETARAEDAALAAIAEGRDPVIFSSRGPDDPSVSRFRAAVEASGIEVATANENVGAGLGRILCNVALRAGVKRGVIAGGDTSGHGALTMGIHALTAKVPVAPGAPLCEAHSEDAAINGFEIALKGGQMGAPDYFSHIRNGG